MARIHAEMNEIAERSFGRSDTREKLRNFFEVSREFIVLAALRALADEGAIEVSVVVDSMKRLGISSDKVDPLQL